MNKATKIVLSGELRAQSENRTIEGKAISFDTESNYIGFKEILHRGCITQELVDSSNIVFTYDHVRSQILARRKNGQGNLDIQVRDDGVYFSFEAPNTTLGNDLLENIRCGNIVQCSFAFDYGHNPNSYERSIRDGVKYVDVYEIGALYDLSAVVDPAFEDTYIKTRSAEFEEEDEQETDEAKETEPQEEQKEEEDRSEDPEDVQEDQKEDPEERQDDEEEPEPKEDPKEDSEETKENENPDETQEENTNTESEDDDSEENTEKNKRKNNTIMEKRFSLVNAINNIANNRALDEVAQSVNKTGEAEMRSAGLTFDGQIHLPVSELRADVTVAAEGEDVVATDLYDILGPLRSKNVLVQAGAKFLTNLVGDVQIPIMSATNVTWEGETADAKDGAPTFTNVTLSPKRLTAYVNISKKLLAQHSVAVEDMIRQDILNAISSKLEATVLGDGAGSTTQPAGMFNDVELVKEIGSMAKIAEMEANVEEANVYGECKWIVAPSTKAVLRDKAKGGNVAQSLYANGEIDGTQALSTSNVAANTAVYGDFSNLAIGQWGAIDLTVDPYTEAKNGMVVLVVNAYFDAKVLRPEAFAFGTTAA